MNLRRITLHFVLILLAAVSCGETVEPEPVKLTAQPASLTFEAQGGTLDLTLTSGIKPTVTCSESWIKLTEGAFTNNSLKVSVNTIRQYFLPIIHRFARILKFDNSNAFRLVEHVNKSQTDSEGS